MDATRFDALSTSLSQRGSRKDLLLSFVGAAAILAGNSSSFDTSAKSKNNKKKKKKCLKAGNVWRKGKCELKQTVCKPDCEFKDCGDDGCGGSCGVCLQGETCQNLDGGLQVCVCTEAKYTCPENSCNVQVRDTCNLLQNCITCKSGYQCESGPTCCAHVGTSCSQNSDCCEGMKCQDQVCIIVW